MGLFKDCEFFVKKYQHGGAVDDIHNLSTTLQLINETFKTCGEMRVVLKCVSDAITGVHNGCMVAAAEFLSNTREGCVCNFARQVHGHLPGESDSFGPALSAHFIDPDVEEFCDGALDGLDGNGPVLSGW